MIYCHKPAISVAMEPLQLWFAKSLYVGDFFEKKIGFSEIAFSRKARRTALRVKAKKFTVSALESRGEVSFLYLTDGNFTYRMKLLEGKQIAFLMDFGEGDHSRWTSN